MRPDKSDTLRTMLEHGRFLDGQNRRKGHPQRDPRRGQGRGSGSTAGEVHGPPEETEGPLSLGIHGEPGTTATGMDEGFPGTDTDEGAASAEPLQDDGS